MPLHLTLTFVVLAISGLLLLATKLAYHWPRLASARIHPEPGRKLRGARLYRSVLGNMILSGAIIVALAWLAADWLVHARPVTGLGGWVWVVVQAGLVLLVYDFFYYLMHRFAFHEWTLLRRVHVVHHRVRHPHAVDSLYLHPVETALGVCLLLACAAALGPVHPVTFAVILAVHASLNILVHSGLDLPFFPFRAVSFLARKHDIHHTSMKGGNYASLTPIFDRLFGTAE